MLLLLGGNSGWGSRTRHPLSPPPPWELSKQMDWCGVQKKSPELFFNNVSFQVLETRPPPREDKSQLVPLRSFFWLGSTVGGGWWLFKSQTGRKPSGAIQMLLLLGGKSGWGLVVVPESDTPSPHLPTTTLTALESHLDKKARDAWTLAFDVNAGIVMVVGIVDMCTYGSTKQMDWCGDQKSPLKYFSTMFLSKY